MDCTCTWFRRRGNSALNSAGWRRSRPPQGGARRAALHAMFGVVAVASAAERALLPSKLNRDRVRLADACCTVLFRSRQHKSDLQPISAGRDRLDTTDHDLGAARI